MEYTFSNPIVEENYNKCKQYEQETGYSPCDIVNMRFDAPPQINSQPEMDRLPEINPNLQQMNYNQPQYGYGYNQPQMNYGYNDPYYGQQQMNYGQPQYGYNQQPQYDYNQMQYGYNNQPSYYGQQQYDVTGGYMPEQYNPYGSQMDSNNYGYKRLLNQRYNNEAGYASMSPGYNNYNNGYNGYNNYQYQQPQYNYNQRPQYSNFCGGFKRNNNFVNHGQTSGIYNGFEIYLNDLTFMNPDDGKLYVYTDEITHDIIRQIKERRLDMQKMMYRNIERVRHRDPISDEELDYMLNPENERRQEEIRQYNEQCKPSPEIQEQLRIEEICRQFEHPTAQNMTSAMRQAQLMAREQYMMINRYEGMGVYDYFTKAVPEIEREIWEEEHLMPRGQGNKLSMSYSSNKFRVGLGFEPNPIARQDLPYQPANVPFHQEQLRVHDKDRPSTFINPETLDEDMKFAEELFETMQNIVTDVKNGGTGDDVIPDDLLTQAERIRKIKNEHQAYLDAHPELKAKRDGYFDKLEELAEAKSQGRLM